MPKKRDLTGLLKDGGAQLISINREEGIIAITSNFTSALHEKGSINVSVWYLFDEPCSWGYGAWREFIPPKDPRHHGYIYRGPLGPGQENVAADLMRKATRKPVRVLRTYRVPLYHMQAFMKKRAGGSVT
jgi:hypothetical protein